MNPVWETRPFEECIEKVHYTNKVQRKDFLEHGEFPIISQEEAYINGYWDSSSDVFRVDCPIVLFGDHTRALKYVDFDFVLGADGVKILKPRPFLSPKFLYYQLKSLDLDALGYARHYRVLKERVLSFPYITEQKRIVGILDEAFEAIAKAKANAKRNLVESEFLLNSFLSRVLSGPTPNCVNFGDLVANSRGGVNIGSRDYRDDGVPVLTKGDVKALGVLQPGGKYVSPQKVRSSNWPSTKPGDLIVTTRDLKPSAPFLGSVAVVPADRNYIVSQGATVFSVNQERVLPRFFVYSCCSEQYRAHIRARKVGSTQVHIRQDDLFAIPLWIPSIGEQGKIVRLLDELVRRSIRIASLYKRKLWLMDDLKKSLLRTAFSGELTAR